MSDAPAGTRSPHFAQEAAAQTYRRLQLPYIFAPWAKVLLEVVPPAPGESVLDVATGPGTVARQAALAAGPSGRVTGVDISAAMLAVARSWPADAGAAPIDYVEASAGSLALSDASFDVAYCQQGMQHMDDPLLALAEIRRLLRPAGRLGLALWVTSPFGLFRRVAAEMGLAGRASHPSNFGHDASELEAALRNSGFRDVEVHTRELIAILDGGIPQALEIAEGTSAGEIMASLSEARRREVRAAMTRALEPFLDGSAVQFSTVANLAQARK